MEMEHNSWTRPQVAQLYRTPLLELMHRAAQAHCHHHDPCQIQVCTLLSIKTGGCPEDCGYCSQSAHYQTGLQRQPLLEVEEVVGAAQRAKEAGSTRFCMGAAWRQAREGEEFDQVLEMVRQVSSLGLEVCCTLGMLSQEQALRLKEAGLYAYNHNLDTGPQYYRQVVSTRTYQDRLQTLAHVAQAGLSVCCGGILGLGESEEDRIDLLHTLVSLPTPPESVPVNALVPIPGTPLGQQPRVSVWELVRMIAAARILFPRAMVRLSAGRDQLSDEAQALCFLAGANSIFSGDKLLTTPHPGFAKDAELFALLGLQPRAPYEETSADTTSPMQR
ncbi:MAG: biotin synthase BioB [Candidatus Latescibacteria bacterium]|nr:biotin synthase BioB [Candidatus Latescibacterota bacterium]